MIRCYDVNHVLERERQGRAVVQLACQPESFAEQDRGAPIVALRERRAGQVVERLGVGSGTGC